MSDSSKNEANDVQEIKEKSVSEEQQKTSSVEIDEHLMPLEAVCERYGVKVNAENPTQSEGLSSDRHSKLLKEYGPNVMTPPKEVPLVLQYLVCLANLFNILLIISSALCFIVYAVDSANAKANLYIGPILLLVAMLNALIEFVQDQKSKAILKSFIDMVPRKCTTVRDGNLDPVEASTLVPGDCVCLRMGDKIPADVYLFNATDFKVDNSSLTGESDPQTRGPGNKQDNPLEASNLAFNGSLAVNGEAYGIVIRTGDSTVLGQIANMAGSEEKRESPMTQEINRFVHLVAAVATVTAICFFLGSLTMPIPIATKINFAIGVFISFVPEGLPATMTMLLSIAAKRMAKRNVLVKDLRGVETLGAITCLATDKTGTLTRNQMTVTYVWAGQKMYDALSNSPKAVEEASNVAQDVEKGKSELNNLPKQSLVENYPLYDYGITELSEMAHVSYLCSKARFDRKEGPIKQRTITADATETGLFKFAAEVVPDSDNLRDRFPKVFEIPFNSANKWALSIHHKPHDNGDLTLYIKGAPERVFNLCSTFMNEGAKISELTDAHKSQFQTAYEVMASKGHRVLGCATLLLPRDKYPKNFQFVQEENEVIESNAPSGMYPTEGYTFLGLVSLEDPPKHGVREAIGKCRQAGIKVMMVTGDHPLTAEAIARKINLMLQETKEMVAKRTNRNVASIQEHEYHAIVIHGEQIDDLSDDDWENILDKEEIIFARTSPKHKLQIVKRCQERGHIVGVTGDGVNDSPALKKADLGIAMNISGSDVSKEAAAMILLDDNFASTVSGIAEGRLIFQNLKKSIRYTLTHTMPEVLANLMFLIVPIPLPLDPLQIIVIDLGFELAVSLAYAWEAAEAGYDSLMINIPRKPVTAKSIDLNRRQKAAEKLKTAEINEYVYGTAQPADAEAQAAEKIPLGTKIKFSLARMHYFFAHLFDKKAWDLYFEPREEEVLVDRGLLSYSYLEMGIIEAIACFTAYFLVWWFQFGASPAQVRAFASGDNPQTKDESFAANEVAYTQTVYYMSIFFLQCYNHFICKRKYEYPFGWGMFKNLYTWYGLFVGAVIAFVVAYAPGQIIPFSTVRVNPVYFVPAICMGFVMLAYGSIRIAIIRRSRPVNLNLDLPLDLHPTRYSTKSVGK